MLKMGWAALGQKNALYVANVDESLDRFWRSFFSDFLGAHLNELKQANLEAKKTCSKWGELIWAKKCTLCSKC